MLLDFVASATPQWIVDIKPHSGFLKNSLFLVKVCALHFKQLLECLSKRLISETVYDRIAQRIERENRNDNGMGQNYYVHNVSTTLKRDLQKYSIRKYGQITHKQSH